MGVAGDGKAFDPLALCRSVVKRDRSASISRLRELTPDAADSTARVAIGFFKSVMLGSGPFDTRAKAAMVVEKIASALYLDDHAKAAAITVALWMFLEADKVKQ